MPASHQMIQTGFAYQRPDDAARTFVDMDVDHDGRVELRRVRLLTTPRPRPGSSTPSPSPTRDPFADALTDELFKLFDTDKDGKLSRAELTAVEELFATLDADEDECLSRHRRSVPDLGRVRRTRPGPAPKGPPRPVSR